MRTITEGQAIELLELHFGLSAPVAFEDIKKKYRKESKRLHPDSSSPDSSEDAFKALSGAFDGLKHLYQIGSRLFDAEPMSDDAAEGEPQPPKMPRETVNGTPLSELGLGLGPTTNGKECTECDSLGYKVVHEHGFGKCAKCEGHGYQPREFRCRACDGSGRFVQRRSLREVDCRVCQGTGIFKHPFYTESCSACFGVGRGKTEKVVSIYILKCYTCKGTGETEVWNPVLPKGRLVFNGTPPASTKAPATPITPEPRWPGKDKLFGEEDPNRMSDLLQELKLKGVGGKR